jgi:small subunit ribosomal protein S25e
MGAVQQKSKEAKARAAMAGGKGKRKKWSKTKNRETLKNAVMFDTKVLEKLEKEVSKLRLITVAIVSEKLKVTGSLARVGIRHLEQQGQIKRVVQQAGMYVYTRATKA